MISNNIFEEHLRVLVAFLMYVAGRITTRMWPTRTGLFAILIKNKYLKKLSLKIKNSVRKTGFYACVRESNTTVAIRAERNKP